MKIYTLSKQRWLQCLQDFLSEYHLYAPIKKEESVDYEEITVEKLDSIHYDGSTPTTPLKAFYLPVKENVVNISKKLPRIILGVPNCDLIALDLLDNIYLDEEYVDPCYKQNRENTIVFGKDCYQCNPPLEQKEEVTPNKQDKTAESKRKRSYGIKDSCHCTAYKINPYPEKNCDVSMSLAEDKVYLSPVSDKGIALLEKFKLIDNESQDSLPETVTSKRQQAVKYLQEQNKDLPDEVETRKIIEKDNDQIWENFSEDCVSCGACSFICPTCHCFLLIDKRSFEKVRNWDVCQYPGFARVAAGEDPLDKLSERFQFRYFCKYSYKPDMFKAIACTGCGRCIDTCIGKIDKNKLIKEGIHSG